jgi:predicted PurR-regulated permease PerM
MANLLPMPMRPGAGSSTNGVAGLMTLISAVVIVVSLSVARDVLIPITLAVLLSFVLAPVVHALRRVWLGRVPAVLVAVLFALSVILGTGGLIGTQVASLANDIPLYASTVQRKLDLVQGVTIGRLSAFVDSLSNQIDRGGRPAAPRSPARGGPAKAAALGDTKAKADAPPIAVEVHQPAASPIELAQRVLAPILSPLANTGIVVMVAIFILLRQEDLRDRLIRLLGTGDLHRTMMAMDEAGHRLSRYFLTLLALNTAFGCVIALGLSLIGVPNPVLWGLTTILMRFVPYIGTSLSAVLPLVLAAAVDPGWSMMLWTAALFVVAEGLMGQVVEPMAYGSSTGLSPLSVVVAAIFWGWLWGPVGLILSMPLTLCLVIAGRHVDRLKFLDVLLGDGKALTPVESFYNCLLAGHLDEVQDGAEQLLKSCSLASYYDEVAVPGLRLATLDLERDVLNAAQKLRIVAGVGELLDELSDHVDIDPVPPPLADGPAGPFSDAAEAPDQKRPAEAEAPEGVPSAWRNGAVLCVAGRGPVDELGSAMLAQLLTRQGIGARVVPHIAVSARGVAVAEPEWTRVRMVCLTYVGIAGTSSHLRYAVRRIRARYPATPILVGLWPAGRAGEDRLRTAVGADLYTASLREAVTACMTVAQGAPAEAGR